MTKIVHWKLCERYQKERNEKWFEHVPEGVVENDEVKLLLRYEHQGANIVEARRLDIIVVSNASIYNCGNCFTCRQ